jgi:hypothetical protein
LFTWWSSAAYCLLPTAVARCLARLVARSGLAHNIARKNLFAGLVGSEVYERYLAADANTVAVQNAYGLIPHFVICDYPDLGPGAQDVDMGMLVKKMTAFEIKGVRTGSKEAYGQRKRNVLAQLPCSGRLTVVHLRSRRNA